MIKNEVIGEKIGVAFVIEKWLYSLNLGILDKCREDDRNTNKKYGLNEW